MSEEENVFLFVPNLTGYGRIVLALISFYFMPTHYAIACWCYVISGLLDAIDGHAARYFNQSTKFGAMLDQLTDRVGTMCLCVTLSTFYPKYQFLFQLSMAIDIACHWIYLHSPQFNTIVVQPHRKLVTNQGQGFHVRCRYRAHPSEPELQIAGFSLFRLVCYVSAPVALVKSAISLIHGYVACQNLAIIDVQERKHLTPAAPAEKSEVKAE
ncbi:CDP-diacylglycerol--inositol 3-phosphatidyltransferase-like [Diaphorina citri]|uniref:CDP-diacylglycerol--inositol 3-phosphatidyltransferase n=1 Tax=Diaphorina citri TaxID=121845 RepID=A0A1S3DCF4_DIACI|nr:CDP-diacylglycerol--inositol 3-phosphatidyltransferase-like [Diaphorina citri]